MFYECFTNIPFLRFLKTRQEPAPDCRPAPFFPEGLPASARHCLFVLFYRKWTFVVFRQTQNNTIT